MTASATDALQAEHPNWHLWRSGGGSFMATRRKALSLEEVFPLANTLMESTAEDLAGKLAEQKRLAGGAA